MLCSYSSPNGARMTEFGGKLRRYGINIRLAKTDDIPNISKCNIENLPENYSNSFYIDHLSKWPELSIIAETSKKELVGYALGRIETIIKEDPYKKVFRPHDIGHIASLAVNQNFRGLGVAQSLMGTLHRNFASHYGIDSVSLYCRVSNAAALGLYSKVFAYRCDRLVEEYYPDKESAWIMSLSGLLEVKSTPAAVPASNSKPAGGSFQDSDSLQRVSNSS
eukprot:gene27385-36153_t